MTIAKVVIREDDIRQIQRLYNEIRRIAPGKDVRHNISWMIDLIKDLDAGYGNCPNCGSRIIQHTEKSSPVLNCLWCGFGT